jgi:hypothetical protein
VLDNIRPLRKLAATSGKVLDQPLVAFEPAETYLATYQGPQGYGKDAEGIYQAKNRPAGVNLTYYIKPKLEAAPTPGATIARAGKKPRNTAATEPGVEAGNKTDESGSNLVTPLPAAAGTAPTLSTLVTAPDSTKMDSVKVSVYDETGRLVRTLKQAPDTALGAQRISWDLTETAIALPTIPGARRFGREPTGDPVMPGKYKMVVAYNGARDSTFVTVQPDPRVPFDKKAMAARRVLQDRINKNILQVTAATKRIQDATNATELLLAQLKTKEGKEITDLRQATKAMQDSLKSVRETIVGKRSERQGFARVYSVTPVLKLQEAGSYVSRRTEAPTITELQLVEQAEALTREALGKVNAFFSSHWAAYYKKVQATPVEVVKEYEPIGQAVGSSGK